MHATRLEIMKLIHQNPAPKATEVKEKISEYFGELTFGLSALEKRIPANVLKDYKEALSGKTALDMTSAQKIADAVKDWALEKGATHFTHWFQPLTGLTAEKHDSFLSFDFKTETFIEKFNASQLIMSEPDASSFPSGGTRSTFEARGYTAWDLSSPMFIVENAGAKILCIPSVFVSYTGNSLDTKTSLLKSMNALSAAACDFLTAIGEKKPDSVTTTIGAEQEYFLIDRAYYKSRPDLVMSGRTLQGASMARGQQLEDHYFGSIPARVQAFMADFDRELYKLGIPAKTRHNEVAPGQFEIAPIFEVANVASDHNMLLMEVLRRTSQEHGFECLLHEKPFAGINGSGKHNNWSIATSNGENLLEPGNTPHENFRFLAVLSVVLKAVYDHQIALRGSIASHGNDHRLGANEAPPAIISVFVGSLLTQILEKIEKGEDLSKVAAEKAMINFGLNQLPNLPKDNTDRNRTSPFAFTGNKFEFRAVGSSQNVSFPITILNTAVTQTFKEFITRLKNKAASAASKESAVLEVAKEFIVESKNIRFEGNGYGEEWKKEAHKRGLSELLTTPDSLKAMEDKKNSAFLMEAGVFTGEELHSVLHVNYERYSKKLGIEAKTLLQMTQQYILPAAFEAQNEFARSIKAVESLGEATSSLSTQRQYLRSLLELIDGTFKKTKTLTTSIEEAEKTAEGYEQAHVYASKVLPEMTELRDILDKIEDIVPDQLWPLPKYQEMLFTR
ncbi:MAG: glutamine synthetase III [Bdellovibrionota bacterium]